MPLWLSNIPVLLNNLRDNNWHITSFLFKYKNVKYIVLFEDLKCLSSQLDNYFVLLTFIDSSDIERVLTVRANSSHFEFQVKEFREYFGIEYTDNLGDVFHQFYTYFNRFIPLNINLHYTVLEKELIVNRLNQRDGDNNICCYAVKRNPMVNGKQYHRSIFNEEKCRLLKPELYKYFKNDNTISFCFRNENELSTDIILTNFAKQ